MKLKAGDTLVIPEGWTVEFRDSRVEIQHKNYMAESTRGFSFYEFLKRSAERASDQKLLPGGE